MSVSVLAGNADIFYVDDTSRIMEFCQEIKPTIFVLIPRMIEKLFHGIAHKIEIENPIKKTLAKWAFNLALKTNQNWWTLFTYPIADKILYSK